MTDPLPDSTRGFYHLGSIGSKFHSDPLNVLFESASGDVAAKMTQVTLARRGIG